MKKILFCCFASISFFISFEKIECWECTDPSTTSYQYQACSQQQHDAWEEQVVGYNCRPTTQCTY